jgi:hypothetical protein
MGEGSDGRGTSPLVVALVAALSALIGAGGYFRGGLLGVREQGPRA